MYQLIEREVLKQGKTFAWLTKKTGIPSALFSTMKRRNSLLNPVYLKKVARALHVSMASLTPDEWGNEDVR